MKTTSLCSLTSALALTLLTACDMAADAPDTDGPDTAPVEQASGAIKYGTDELRENAVVQISHRGLTCTGVLISPEQVLTSSQCIRHDMPRAGMFTDRGVWESSGGLYGFYPARTVNAALNSGYKRQWDGFDGPSPWMEFDAGYDRMGTDYSARSGVAYGACIDACSADRRCVAFTHRASDNRCWLKEGYPVTVKFGATAAAPAYTTRAFRYGVAGAGNDLAILKLEAPVPDNQAKPKLPVTTLEAGETAESLLGASGVRVVGFGADETGATPATRKSAAFAFGAMPTDRAGVEDPNAFDFVSTSRPCRGTTAGDLGGAVLDPWGRLVGVVSATSACGGIATATFGPGNSDPWVPTMSISRWLQSEATFSHLRGWTEVSAPTNARRIAADAFGNLYVQKTDGRVFVSATGGTAGSYVLLTTLPADLRSLTASVGGLYYLTAGGQIRQQDAVTHRDISLGTPDLPWGENLVEIAATEDASLDFTTIFTRDSAWNVSVLAFDFLGRSYLADTSESAVGHIAFDREHMFQGFDGELTMYNRHGFGFARLGVGLDLVDIAVAARGQSNLNPYIYRLTSTGAIFRGEPGYGDWVL